MAEARGYTAEWIKPAEQLRYKFLISTVPGRVYLNGRRGKDGSTIDDTRVYWMLSSGSVAP